MYSLREEIVNNGTMPILSVEGSRCLFEEYFKSITQKKGYDTRRIELPNYKSPNDLEPIDREQLNKFTLEIVILLINKMKSMVRADGYESVYNSLPSNYAKVSYDEFLSIFSLGEEDIIKYIANFNDGHEENFINKLIDISKLDGDRIGKTTNIPYGNDESHPKDADFRIYINVPNGENRYIFLEKYIEKCISRNIPYEMKGDEHKGKEKDRAVLYCFDEYFDETVQILEEIKAENPELVSNIGSPLATGLNYSYYAIGTSRKAATHNLWFNRISSHAINYLCANLIKDDTSYFSSLSDEEKRQIKEISKISNYSFDSEGYFVPASNSIINDYIIKNRETVIQEENCQRLIETLKVMCSLGNFQDLEHSDFPISLDKKFYGNYELSSSPEISEERNDPKEKELYLYHTEKLIDDVLSSYQQGNISFERLMEDYLKAIEIVYKNYSYYAVREPGFVLTSRHKDITEVFRRIYTGYEIDEIIDESYPRIARLEYYKAIQEGLIKYLNEKATNGQDISE